MTYTFTPEELEKFRQACQKSGITQDDLGLIFTNELKHGWNNDRSVTELLRRLYENLERKLFGKDIQSLVEKVFPPTL